ncbi:restriction endonuclease subunit S [Aeromonas veronii]
MVPKGWKKTHLKCVISGAIKNGYSPLPASTTTGYWVLSLGAFTDHGINPLEIKPVVVDEKVKQALLSGGDFLVSRSNTPNKVGRSIRFKNEVQNCSYPDLMMRFCIDTTKADPDFIEIKLKSTEVRQYYKSCAAGSSSSMVKINKAVVENTPLLLPSFPEQKKIAKILSTWDKAISTTEQLLANSQQQKKALMQQLLTGKKRLLDNNGVRFSGAWNLFSLKSICEFIKDGTHGTHIRYESGVPLLSAINITKEGQIDFDGAPFISNEDYEKIHSKYQISMGDILITVVGTLGRVALVETDSKFTLQRSVAILRIKENISNKFMKQIFSAPEFTETLVKKSNSTAQAGVYLGELAKICIRIPEFEEQQKIAAVLSTADKEISALQQKLDALKQEKKALMQQLLTGKRRVTVN